MWTLEQERPGGGPRLSDYQVFECSIFYSDVVSLKSKDKKAVPSPKIVQTSFLPGAARSEGFGKLLFQRKELDHLSESL